MNLMDLLSQDIFPYMIWFHVDIDSSSRKNRNKYNFFITTKFFDKLCAKITKIFLDKFEFESKEIKSVPYYIKNPTELEKFISQLKSIFSHEIYSGESRREVIYLKNYEELELFMDIIENPDKYSHLFLANKFDLIQ